MDGLTREELQAGPRAYNHALFRNNMFFMDIEWEIDIRTGSAYALEDKLVPARSRTRFDYRAVYQMYLDERVRESERGLFVQYLSLENLEKLVDEVSLDLHILSPEGEYDHHRVVLTPSFDDGGGLSCVYLGVRNLQAETRRAQEAYRSQELFRDALMSNCFFWFDFDVTGDGLIRNDCVTSTGFRPIQAATGRELPIHYDDWANAWYDQYRPQFEKRQEEKIFSVAYLKKAFARNDRVFDVEVRMTPPAGSGCSEFMQIFVVLMEDPETQHVRCYVIWREINAARRKAIEENLKLQRSNLDLQNSNRNLQRTLSQEEQFRLASLSGSLMVFNINLTRDLIEDEFYEIVDGDHYPMLQMVDLTAPCSFDEFCRRWSRMKIPRESRKTFLELFNRSFLLDVHAKGQHTVEFEFDTVIGRGIPVTLRSTALLLEDQESGDILAMVSGKDVSARRAEEYRQREALRSAYEAANNANAAKSEFLARMSHDIRTPMNAIIGMTAIAGTHLEDTERVADCLSKISVSSRHLLSLINEVLDMSKIESGKVDLQEECFDLPELVENLLTMCKPQLRAKGHEVSVSIHGITHEKVIGDSQRLQQSLMNLMSNAIKYTPCDGRIRLTITEKPTNRPRVGCYEFIFQDNGIGMSEEYQKHLFEPFSRAEDSRVEKVQGTGLGMAITKNIVQMMNGSIRVKSRLNKGTTITVTVFLKLQEGEEEAGSKDFADLPILVADDDEAACLFTCQVLRELGMQGEWVLSGQAAVERVVERHGAQDDFYAVILDWKMPEMDGLAATRAIRARVGEEVPIIIISAYDWTDIEQEARAAGATAFIGKPLFKCRLAQLFHELMGHDISGAQHSVLDGLAREDLRGRRALLAEDNDLNAEIAVEVLGMTGMTVDRVANGKEAVDRLSEAEDGYYDIVFMDIQMPVMNGFESARAIRALGRSYTKRLPILAMSANAFAEDVRTALSAGMNGHIAKPLDFAQLDKALRKWLKKQGHEKYSPDTRA